jgi:UDP-3-O-[3-hydroxymyristoyl] glucosamine N-acyltransferase
MEHPGFFERAGPFSLRAIADATGSEIAADANPDLEIKDVPPMDTVRVIGCPDM